MANEEPPEEANVYSDGSVKNLRIAHLQVGGVGVYWPNRNGDEVPLTEDEKQ